MDDTSDFSRLNDSALLSWREQVRAELERLPPVSPEHAALTARYDQSTTEVNCRAREAWQLQIAQQATQQTNGARQ